MWCFLLFRKGEDEQVVVGARAQLRVRSERLMTAVELRVGGLPDLPHPALTEEGGHVVVAESGAGCE